MGATGRKSTVIFDSHLQLVTGGLTDVILIVLAAVHLQFHGRFFFFFRISLRPVLGIVAAFDVGTVWSSHS